ncbi:hypothetical protein BV25DRAFT_1917650 [Artomyces pyxidatus]|uniref:Uncharacterized protein n=1 Tax=Artomyces pyxidatus TaxID=48021 RepID=A0ACB8SVN6_9AGAM|nr:hypothetical protein BV25DRAFT_1917650 [Artomyces pyxidatus]
MTVDTLSSAKATIERPQGDIGIILIGSIFAALLYGITSQQTVFYFTHFHQDGLIVRIWVITLWILDTATTWFVGLIVYNYFINHFGTVVYHPLSDWSFSISSITTGTIIFLVHAFFIIRIRKLRKSVYPTSKLNDALVVFFGILAVYSYASSIEMTYFDFRFPKGKVEMGTYVSNISVETALDLFITIALVGILQQHRHEFAKRKNPIEQLMIFFITRGIILTTFQTLMLILPYTDKTNYAFFAPYCCLSKVYVNSALVTYARIAPLLDPGLTLAISLRLNNRERFLRQAPQYEGSHRCTSIEFTIPGLRLSNDETPPPHAQSVHSSHVEHEIELSGGDGGDGHGTVVSSIHAV